MVRVTPRIFLLAPDETAAGLPPGALALRTLPTRAFGDGTHATTRLCAQAVDAFCRRQPGAAVLDVGTGTGVLARVARAHGARLVVGTDVDPRALAAARDHAALDGDRGALIVSDKPPDAWGAPFDLVVANILEDVLVALAPSLRAALAPEGTLVLSGFSAAQSPSLRAAFASLAVEMQVELDGWVLLQLRRVN